MAEALIFLMYLAILGLTAFVAHRAGVQSSYGKGFTDGYADGSRDGEFLAAIRQVSR
jgi:hypothetical protein